MHPQIPLHISLRDTCTFDSFYPATNTMLVSQLQDCARAGQEPYIYLWGNSGVGKSHLLQATCHEASRKGLTSVYLPLSEIRNLGTDVLEGLESLDLICLDDVHLIAGDKLWEEAVFNLFNRARDSHCCLVIASRASPTDSKFSLPDLLSRLGSGPVYRINELDDQGKQSALQLHARNRGFDMPDDVANYLLKHCPRDMVSLFKILDQLDEASLSAQRKLTIPFVSTLLGALSA